MGCRQRLTEKGSTRPGRGVAVREPRANAAADLLSRGPAAAAGLEHQRGSGKVPIDATHANVSRITNCQLPKKTCDDVLRVRHANLKGRELALSSCFANDKSRPQALQQPFSFFSFQPITKRAATLICTSFCQRLETTCMAGWVPASARCI